MTSISLKLQGHFEVFRLQENAVKNSIDEQGSKRGWSAQYLPRNIQKLGKMASIGGQTKKRTQKTLIPGLEKQPHQRNSLPDGVL